MWIAKDWRDYELLDCGGGEKLERWGDYLLVRPDPQVIWDTPRKNRGWKHMNGHYHRSAKGGGEWEFFKKLPDRWSVRYGALEFYVRPTGFKHTGLFPEQSCNWAFIREHTSPGDQVLNLFAYTGGATCACAKAGAQVVHVDAAKGMVQWAKDNAAASGLEEAPIRYIVDDCLKFVRREQRRGNFYEGILMDPPSYGRGPGGEMWKIETGLYELVQECVKILSPDPCFFLINSYTTGLAPSVLKNVLTVALPAGIVQAEEVGLPIRREDLVLPCGATGRWMPCSHA